MTATKIGLLPLYIELYDRASPAARPRIEGFYAAIAGEFQRRGLDVVTVPVCRLESEFAEAVAAFEKAGVDAIVTLHLAYSPSLESAKALAATALPIVVLDTTPTFEFGPEQDPAEVMFNHGIHGVQDMCNLLLRNGKDFQIETGHYERSDVLDRVAGCVRSARAARRMQRARIGRIGRPFAGMGDFAVPDELLRAALGASVVQWDPSAAGEFVAAPDSPEVAAEMAADADTFHLDGLDAGLHRAAAQTCVAVRRWMEREDLDGFTMNFLALDRAFGLPAVPFLEGCKAMARGKGYAGEGDVLTAALIAGLAAAYPATTFTEMFCPDWAGERVFLSHMGELNIALTADRPRLMQRPFPFTDMGQAAVAVGRLRGGDAVLVNAAPGPDKAFSLIAVPVEMLDVTGEDRFGEKVRGWFRPRVPLREFLKSYSLAGGTHHCALVYGASVDEILGTGALLGWGCRKIG